MTGTYKRVTKKGMKTMKTRMRTRVARSATRHGSTIFAVLAALGVVLTGYLAAKAAPEAKEKLDEATEAKAMEEAVDFEDVTLTFGEKVKVCAPVYWKAVASGVVTVLCIVGSRIIAIHELASVTGTLAATTAMGSKYVEKMKKEVGEDREAEIRKEARKETVEARAKKGKKGKKTGGKVYKTGLGNERFYDPWNDRKFKCSPSAMRDAAERVNRGLEENRYLESADDVHVASLNDYWKEINLPETRGSEMIGFVYNIPAFTSLRSYCDTVRMDLSSTIELDGHIWTVVDFRDQPEGIDSL